MQWESCIAVYTIRYLRSKEKHEICMDGCAKAKIHLQQCKHCMTGAGCAITVLCIERKGGNGVTSCMPALNCMLLSIHPVSAVFGTAIRTSFSTLRKNLGEGIQQHTITRKIQASVYIRKHSTSSAAFVRLPSK